MPSSIRDDPDFRGDINNLLRALKQREAQQSTSRWRRRLPYIGVLALIALVIAGAALITLANNSGTRLDLIVSNGTQTRVFSIALTNVINGRPTLTAASAASATPLPQVSASSEPTAEVSAAATDSFRTDSGRSGRDPADSPGGYASG